jgi:RNA-directed DNA polymerase
LGLSGAQRRDGGSNPVSIKPGKASSACRRWFRPPGVALPPVIQCINQRATQPRSPGASVMVFSRASDSAAALAVVRGWTEKSGLTPHPVKTKLVDARTEGFDFLGCHFERGRRWPRRKSLDKLKDAIRAKTGRNVGKGLPMVVADLNPALRGWFGYFKHSHRPTFRIVDGWVRRRPRSILRRQQRLEGIAKTHGAGHVRRPNAFFTKLGLFSLQGARDAVSQSSRR